MQYAKAVIVFCLGVILEGPAAAVELHAIEVRRGTDGLVEVPLTLANRTGGTLACIGELAHWYSAELVQVEPGGTGRIELWYDPATGALTVLNDKRENMPVEGLWCGMAGRAYATRSVIALARKAGETPGPMALSCTLVDGGRTDCR